MGKIGKYPSKNYYAPGDHITGYDPTQGMVQFTREAMEDFVLNLKSTSNYGFAAGYTTQSVVIPGVEWTPLSLSGSVNYDYKRRFIDKIDGGVAWLQYTSLLERTFFVSVTAVVEKTAGTGEAFIAIVKKDGSTGAITVLETRVGRSRFGSDIGTQDISVEAPVSLKKGDYIAYVARKTDGDFSIGVGSGIKVVEA